MDKRYFVSKFLLAVFLGLVLFVPATNAFADHGRWEGSLPRNHQVVSFGRERFHFHEGRFFRPGFFGFGFVAVEPPVGIIITALPFGYRTLVIGGDTYYCYNDVYYRVCPGGYAVVPAPVVSPNVVVVPQVQGDAVVINIPNSRGGYNPVRLVRRGGGYVGPQGEYYAGNPTIEQLRALYGN